MNKDSPMRLQVAGEILPNITNRMEIAGYNDRDIMAIKAIACYEGLNMNDALFERDDLEKAVNSLIGKPVRILFDGMNPTGHGYNRETKRFSNLVANIGFIHWAYGEENESTGRYEVIVEMIVWQKYYPEITTRLRQLHRENDLNFSIEAERNFDLTPEGYRRCYNILFNGIAVVQNPAFQEAKSLMVAEILKKGGNEKMEDILKILSGINDKIGSEIAEQLQNGLGAINTTITDLKGQLKAAQTEITDFKTEIAEKDGTIKTLEVDRDKYKHVVETAEKEKLGKERLEKLSKYGKVEKTAEELAEMTKEAFVDELEKIVMNYNPQETAEVDGAIGVKFEKNSSTKLSNKEKLLGFCQGLK